MSNAIQSFEKIKTAFAKKMQINRPRDGAFIDNNLSGDPEVWLHSTTYELIIITMLEKMRFTLTKESRFRLTAHSSFEKLL